MSNHMVRTSYKPATSAYGSHMGTCYHFPAYARAWTDRSAVEINSSQYPSLDAHALIEKAVAILRRQIKGRRS